MSNWNKGSILALKQVLTVHVCACIKKTPHMLWLVFFFNYSSQMGVKLMNARDIWLQKAWYSEKKNLVKNTSFH